MRCHFPRARLAQQAARLLLLTGRDGRWPPSGHEHRRLRIHEAPFHTANANRKNNTHETTFATLEARLQQMATTPTRQHHSVQRKAPRTRTRRINSARKRKQNHSPKTAEKGIRRINRAGTTHHDNAETGGTSNTHPGTNKKKKNKNNCESRLSSNVAFERLKRIGRFHRVLGKRQAPAPRPGTFPEYASRASPSKNIRNRTMNRRTSLPRVPKLNPE